MGVAGAHQLINAFLAWNRIVIEREPTPNESHLGHDDTWAIILVDHGSRRAESNEMLNEVVELYRQQTGYAFVEPAHMELAEPSIAQAFETCVRKGANRVVVQPFFLFPGRHWHRDIPNLVAEAAARHQSVNYLVTAPLGSHRLMIELLQHRMKTCMEAASGTKTNCPFCDESRACRWRSEESQTDLSIPGS